MKRAGRILLSLTLCLTVALVYLAVPTGAAVRYLPDVTKDMSKASYWTQKLTEPDQVLAEVEELQAINQTLCAKGAPMYDLANWSVETFDGLDMANRLQRSAEADAKDL